MKLLLKILKIMAMTIAGLVLVLTVTYLFLPKGPRETMPIDDPYGKDRPAARADKYMVSAGNPWAARAACNVLERGGNAVDAAVAGMLVLNVTYGEAASFPGVAPVLVYDAASGKVKGYTGAGTAPAAATMEFYRDKKGYKTMPKMSILAQLLPASPDVITALLKQHGTMSFEELSAPAASLAEEGFPVHRMMLNNLDLNIFQRLGFAILMPYNAKVYLGGQWWRPLHHGERFRRPELAKVFRAMAGAERAARSRGGSREAGLDAVRDYFYRGPVAEAIVRFHRENGGLFTKEDLAGYRGRWEEPLSGRFGPYTVYSNRTWCQGAVVPLALQILEGIDLKSLGHNSPEYIHAVLQAIELAMADRERHMGDPDFVKVPARGLLSREYAAERRKLMTPGRAFGTTPPPGDPGRFEGAGAVIEVRNPAASLALNETGGHWHDTSYISVVDAGGNAVSLTPSDFPQSPMVPGTGLTLGIRMTQFRLDPSHPSALAPGKRPTITPNPSMVLKDGKLFMSFGTPGGDMQTQAIVQTFLNVAVFGMDPQEAVKAPRFRSLNWPDSFSPHRYSPGAVELERALAVSAGGALRRMGYRVAEKDDGNYAFSAVCIVLRDPATGKLVGGADPREESWAQGK
jgi:gamma-glutamyltranspeptidase / glutathione hydrolase